MMFRALSASRAFAAVLLAFALSPALAHGPTRQKVTEKVEINAPAAKVWAVIGNFQDMSWHPSVAKTEGTGGDAPGAGRTLTLKSGGKIEEGLTKYNAAGMTYSYEIKHVEQSVLPVTNYSAHLTVKDSGGKAVVEWRGAFYRAFMQNNPPPELSDEAAVKAVTDFYRTGLEALKSKVGQGG